MPEALTRACRTITAWPRLGALAAGGVATLAMPPVFAWPALIASLGALVLLIDDAVRQGATTKARLRTAAWRGWLFGFGYFLLGTYWMSASLFVEPERFLWLLPFSATLIPAGLAVFYALASAGAAALWRSDAGAAVVLALCLGIAEWLRGHVLTGLPWNVLGYALTGPERLMQLAGVLGVYGLTVLAVLVFALPAAVAIGAAGRRARPRRSLALALVPLAVVGLGYAYGAIRLAGPVPPPVDGVRLRLMQPGVSQHAKWRHENRERIFRDYLELSRRSPAGVDDALAGVTHLVWPESAIPFLLLDSPGALEAISQLLPEGSHLVTGAIRMQTAQSGARHFYNSLLALDDRAHLSAVYDKVHLVPFGEYLPLQGLLEAIGLEQLTRIQGGFQSGGDHSRILEVPGLPAAAPLICYESIFPDEVVGRVRRPGFLLNVTNDGWFGRTAGPHQHFHQARVRAVEQGLPLIRVANTGISAIVDGRGRIVSHLRLGDRGVIDGPLPASLPPTLYARLGDGLFLAMLSLLAIITALVRLRPSLAGEAASLERTQ